MTPEERRLRDRVEELEEQVRQLHALLVPEVQAPVRMTRGQYDLFRALSRGGMISREALVVAIERLNGDGVTANLLNVQIYKLRLKIEPLGYVIECHRGFGFSMTPP